MTKHERIYIYICVHINVYIESFNRDARNLLDHSSHVVKVTVCQIYCELFNSVWQITMEDHSVEQCVQIIKFLLLKSVPFEKRSAHYVIFILAITVLPSRLFDVWWPNSSQPIR